MSTKKSTKKTPAKRPSRSKAAIAERAKVKPVVKSTAKTSKCPYLNNKQKFLDAGVAVCAASTIVSLGLWIFDITPAGLSISVLSLIAGTVVAVLADENAKLNG